jgi:butyrate kinase
MKILVLNPGSTSTKAAVYEDTEEVGKWSITHSREELSQFKSVNDQLSFRYELVIKMLKAAGFSPEDFDCVVSRGGTPPDIHSGATRIGPRLLEVLWERPKQPHASNLGPMIAERIASVKGVPAFIYDPISTDEMNELAHVSGVKGVVRDSMCHVLNTKAIAIAAADEMERDWREMNIIVVHIGGGNSICLWKDGRLDETYPADDAAFSAERCGGMRCEALIKLIKERGMDEVESWMSGHGGVVSLLGTNDLRIVEDRENAGDPEAVLVCASMAYGIAKRIGGLAPVVNGKVDAIVFTGGGAYWKSLINQVCARIEYLNAPIFVKPGENEMKALAGGALRVMKGEEKVWDY